MVGFEFLKAMLVKLELRNHKEPTTLQIYKLSIMKRNQTGKALKRPKNLEYSMLTTRFGIDTCLFEKRPPHLDEELVRLYSH